MTLLSDSNLLNIRHYNCMQVKSVLIRIFDSIINSLLLENSWQEMSVFSIVCAHAQTSQLVLSAQMAQTSHKRL